MEGYVKLLVQEEDFKKHNPTIPLTDSRMRSYCEMLQRAVRERCHDLLSYYTTEFVEVVNDVNAKPEKESK
jgi:hypothetical protein